MDLVVSHIEVNSPVGPTNALTAAAVRAGLPGFREYATYPPLANEAQDDGGTLIVASNGLAAGTGWERLVNLMIEPLAAAVAGAGLSRAEMARAGLYFALPYADPPIADLHLREVFLPAVERRLALPPVKDVSGTQTGAPGLFSLLDRAAQKIARGELELCVLAAVDSYLLEERLEFYDKHRRLKTERNPAGFIPGEAAAICVVESQAHASARQAMPLLRIDALGRQEEPNPATGGKPSTGRGLTAAIREAHAAGAGEPLRWVLSDLDGERYKAFEWGVTLARLHGLIHPEHEHWQAAESVGNVGAAAGGIAMGCLAQAWTRGYALADSALLFAGNDGGDRAAMLVGRAA